MRYSELRAGAAIIIADESHPALSIEYEVWTASPLLPDIPRSLQYLTSDHIKGIPGGHCGAVRRQHRRTCSGAGEVDPRDRHSVRDRPRDEPLLGVGLGVISGVPARRASPVALMTASLRVFCSTPLSVGARRTFACGHPTHDRITRPSPSSAEQSRACRSGDERRGRGGTRASAAVPPPSGCRRPRRKLRLCRRPTDVVGDEEQDILHLDRPAEHGASATCEGMARVSPTSRAFTPRPRFPRPARSTRYSITVADAPELLPISPCLREDAGLEHPLCRRSAADAERGVEALVSWRSRRATWSVRGRG